MKNTPPLFAILILIITSCSPKPAIEGLWVVQSVMVGEEEMTPNARWTRLNANQTQETGNGRFQHSYGTWSLDEETKELTIINSNGLIDANDPFKVTIDEDKMIWERSEEGQNIRVKLGRATSLPETYGDRLLGLWKLDEAIGEGKHFEPTEDGENGDYLFIRWDGRFVIGTAKGRTHGVYNVHGHKPELELIPYGDQVNRDFWKIQYEENTIILTLLNSEKPVMRKFRRIYEFPN